MEMAEGDKPLSVHESDKEEEDEKDIEDEVDNKVSDK
jgi:hypothetical protein